MTLARIPRRWQFGLTVGVLIATAWPSGAAELWPEEVTLAVETFVRQVTADARPDAVVDWLEPYEAGGRVAAYIAHLEGGGFCIAGADDRLLPSYLYNPFGRFDPTNPSYDFILRDVARRLDLLDARAPLPPEYAQSLTARRQVWDQLIRAELPPTPAAASATDPTLLTLPQTAAWHQGSPYNDFCPELTPGADEHMLVGCVATAMAQIMHYWKWPSSGVGTGSVDFNYAYNAESFWWVEPLATDPNIPGGVWSSRLKWEPTGGGQLMINGYWENSTFDAAADISDDNDYLWTFLDLTTRLTSAYTPCPANFAAASYNWDIMPDQAPDPPDAGGLEAAEISYHAAVSVNMDFGLFGSSSFTSNMPYITRFFYDADARFGSPVDAYIVDDIQWSRVVQIRGESDSGGHSWIVAGYNKGTSPWQYLMNLGWGAGATEWLARDDVFPSNQKIVTYIAPEDVVRFVDIGTFGGDGSPDNPYHGLNHALTYAPDNTTLIMKVGTMHTLTGSPAVLDRPMTLKGVDVWIENAP